MRPSTAASGCRRCCARTRRWSTATRVELRFPAKSGQEWDSDIRDPDLAALVRRLKRRGPTAHLLAWKDDRGGIHSSAAEINEDVRERTGGEFSAKDFRTLHGTAAAAISLARTGPRRQPAARKSAVVAAVRAAAEVLSNTPAIARGSYVDPRLLDAYEGGVTIDPARTGSVESELRALLARLAVSQRRVAPARMGRSAGMDPRRAGGTPWDSTTSSTRPRTLREMRRTR